MISLGVSYTVCTYLLLIRIMLAVPGEKRREQVVFSTMYIPVVSMQ